MSVPYMLFSWVPKFFYSQFFITPPKPTQDCTGKTIIVTGANVGLGKEAARHFVRLNAEKVILACRSIEKGEAAKKDIEGSAKRPGVVEVWPLDLGSYESVKQFAERARTLKRLDGVVENAGMLTDKFALLEGNESTITVNVVSTFLLALLLLPKLREVAGEFNTTPTIAVVSSELHMVTTFPERKAPSIFAALNNEKEARMSDRYNLSKLLEVFACREIARRLSENRIPVTINALNPGFCHSELTRENNNIGVRVFKRLIARTTEVGGRTLVHAGLSGKETSGRYLNNCQVTPAAPLVEGREGPAVQEKVWKDLAAKLEEIQPGILKALEGQA